MIDKAILTYIFQHQYDLTKVSDEDKLFVRNNKQTTFYLPNEEDVRIPLVLKYPGIVHSNDTFVYKYMEKIYKPLYETVMTPPRGYVSKESIIIVGIAPGFSMSSFGESNWQYGPSSKTLHEMLSFDYKWYFTNVCKEYFFKNLYNVEMVKQYYPDIIKELQFFDGQRIIFLGSYPIYDKIIDGLELKNYIKVTHPSATRYLRTEEFMALKDKIKEFCK